MTRNNADLHTGANKLYHGTNKKLDIGDIIQPGATVQGIPYAWAHTDPMESHRFAEGQSMGNKEMTEVYTYPVEPIEDDLEVDPRRHEPTIMPLKNVQYPVTGRSEIVSRTGFRVIGDPVLKSTVGQGKGHYFP
jgi:hypothetical protein